VSILTQHTFALMIETETILETLGTIFDLTFLLARECLNAECRNKFSEIQVVCPV